MLQQNINSSYYVAASYAVYSIFSVVHNSIQKLYKYLDILNYLDNRTTPVAMYVHKVIYSVKTYLQNVHIL